MTARDSDISIHVGTILDDKYEIRGYLGAGGMGSVYRAVHLEMGNDVAIKTMHAQFVADAGASARFHREAKIISALRHKNILTVYAFGSWNGLLYIAMEFIDGKSLGRCIDERGPLPPGEMLPILAQICDAMTFAHQHGILHRDLKPDNVLVVTTTDGEPCAKVVDFGIAKLVDDTASQKVTRTGKVVGDPSYLSPEQSQGKPADRRSDIYSFGCLMYEVFSGSKPFRGDSPGDLLVKQVMEAPAPFAARLNISPSIEAITLKAMEKNPLRRYESFAALAADIAELQANPAFKITRKPQTLVPLPNRRLLLTACAGLVMLFGIASALAPGVNKGTGDPYADMTRAELRARADQLLARTINFPSLQITEEAGPILAEAELLRTRLSFDPCLQGRIDWHQGKQRRMYSFYTNKPPTAAEAIPYLERSLSEFESAEQLEKSNQSSSPSFQQKRLMQISHHKMTTLTELRLSQARANQWDASDRAAEQAIAIYEFSDAVQPYEPNDMCQEAFNWLFDRNLAAGHKAECAILMKRKLAFLVRQKCDPHYIEEERQRMGKCLAD